MEDSAHEDPFWDSLYKLIDDEKYAGNRVLIVDDKVVAYGKTVNDFEDTLKKHKGKLCTIIYVPSKDDPTLMIYESQTTGNAVLCEPNVL